MLAVGGRDVPCGDVYCATSVNLLAPDRTADSGKGIGECGLRFGVPCRRSYAGFWVTEAVRRRGGLGAR
jgi:hypothetical protein